MRVVLQVVVDPETAARVEAVAKNQDRSKSAQLRQFIKQGLHREELSQQAGTSEKAAG